MQKIVGVICLVVGILLLLWGHNITNSVGSQVQQIFTGSPTDRAVHFYIGGAVLAILGVPLIFWKRK
jgi:drug/metabolite transporter (DMT)-like permease